MLDVFTNLNVSKKKEIREKVVCNCFSCIQKFKYEILNEPKVETFELERVKKVSTIVVTLPTNLIPIEQRKKLS